MIFRDGTILAKLCRGTHAYVISHIALPLVLVVSLQKLFPSRKTTYIEHSVLKVRQTKDTLFVLLPLESRHYNSLPSWKMSTNFSFITTSEQEVRKNKTNFKELVKSFFKHTLWGYWSYRS